MTDTTVDADVTHVLSWVPASFIEGASHGCWELRSAVADQFGAPPEYDGFDVPEDTPADLLAYLTFSQVGFPVDLEAWEHDIRLTRRFARWQRVPVYYVRRAS
jgi:hypothetical protein